MHRIYPPALLSLGMDLIREPEPILQRLDRALIYREQIQQPLILPHGMRQQLPQTAAQAVEVSDERRPAFVLCH